MPTVINHSHAEVMYKLAHTTVIVPVTDLKCSGFWGRWVEDPGSPTERIVYVPYDRILKITVR